MLPELSKAYLDGRMMLLLGAGASANSSDKFSTPLPMSSELASEMAKISALDYKEEPLSLVYSAVRETNSAALDDFLSRRLTHTKPGKDLLDLLRYRWSRIYTLNIDDTVEIAARATSPQKLKVFGRLDRLVELDLVFDELHLVKLNGSADKLESGLIFAPQEYGAGSANVPPWYRELGQNYSSHVFVFIGSKLNEPLLQHVMAVMREGSQRTPQRGYLISPHATAIEIRHLESLKITHVPGSLADFVNFLQDKVGKPPTGWDLAVAKRPELKKLATGIPAKQQRALNSVLVIGTETVPRTAVPSGAIRNFYKGYKPSWQDILDGVPAQLAAHNDFLELIEKTDGRGKLIGLLGPAGSGKTTALMCVALAFSGKTANPVYYLRESSSDFAELILSLEDISTSPYHLFVERLDLVAKDLIDLYEHKKIRRGTVVFSERQNIWRRRLRELTEKHVAATFQIDRIQKADADPILGKLQIFGPWTRLEKMNVSERRTELFNKSSRQLLIGLLETTNGTGFTQIIRRDYGDIGSDEHQRLLVTVGLATIHRTPIPVNIVGRALQLGGAKSDAMRLVNETEGVVELSNGLLAARHPVYVRELFERIANPEVVRDCIIALLQAFADYEAPVIKHTTKTEGFLFKSIINNRFLRRMMRDDEARVRSIYSEFETTFHVDGLYWLQYGLALRSFGRHDEALEMFKTARTAYTSAQIEHAYAQQLLIMAEKAPDWELAEPLIQEAVQNLRAQKSDSWETDSYPVVALAEGHVKAFRKFHSDAESREIARSYANDLQGSESEYPMKGLMRQRSILRPTPQRVSGPRANALWILSGIPNSERLVTVPLRIAERLAAPQVKA